MVKVNSPMKLNQQIFRSKRLFKIAYVSIPLGIFSIFTQTAIAEDNFGNQGIEFQEDTTVEFEFIISHGAYQSTFGVIDLDSCPINSQGNINLDSCQKTPLLSENKPSDIDETVFRRSTYQDDLSTSQNFDFRGTPGNAVPRPLAEFTFAAGKKYTFYLESSYNGQPAGVVYSTDFLNSKQTQLALFDIESAVTQVVNGRNIISEANQFDALINGGLLLRFDDTGSIFVGESQQDLDFDDFVVGIGGYESCVCADSP